MIKKFLLIVLIFCALICAACFSPWKGDEGIVSIRIGDGNAGGRHAAWLDDYDTEQLRHIITLEGAVPVQPRENIRYGESVKFSVIPGLWTITIEAWEVRMDGDEERRFLIAKGSDTFDIKPGPSNVTVNITPVGKIEIIFISDGGTPAPLSPVYADYGAVIDKPSEMTKDGYTFNGWYTDSDKTIQAVFPITVKEKITLYAGWEAVSQEIIDAVITINLNEIKDSEKSTTKIISLSEIADNKLIINLENDYDAIEWRIKGIKTGGDFFILDLSNEFYLYEDKYYYLYVEALKDDIPYSQTIFIEKNIENDEIIIKTGEKE